jgi:hypothetical protein
MSRGVGIDELETLYRERYRHFLRVAGLISSERTTRSAAARTGRAPDVTP